MSPTNNILLNPVPELTDALRTNAWGLGEGSSVVIADCFPITPEDVDSVRSEVKESGGSKRIVGKAKVVTLEGEHLVVLLDQRGFTVSRRSLSPSTLRSLGSECPAPPETPRGSLLPLPVSVDASIQAM